MRELTVAEFDDVSGGVLAVGAAAGAIVGGFGSWRGGGNAGQVAAGALLGGVSGFFGGLGMWGSAITVGAFGAFASGGGGGGGSGGFVRFLFR